MMLYITVKHNTHILQEEDIFVIWAFSRNTSLVPEYHGPSSQGYCGSYKLNFFNPEPQPTPGTTQWSNQTTRSTTQSSNQPTESTTQLPEPNCNILYPGTN